MRIGLMWYEQDKTKPLSQVIQEASDYYLNKYGKTANVVFVHPSQASSAAVVGIEVEANRAVLPQNYWIGCRDNLDTSGSRE